MEKDIANLQQTLSGLI